MIDFAVAKVWLAIRLIARLSVKIFKPRWPIRRRIKRKLRHCGTQNDFQHDFFKNDATKNDLPVQYKWTNWEIYFSVIYFTVNKSLQVIWAEWFASVVQSWWRTLTFDNQRQLMSLRLLLQLLNGIAHEMTLSQLLAKVLLEAAIENVAWLTIGGSGGDQKTSDWSEKFHL